MKIQEMVDKINADVAEMQALPEVPFERTIGAVAMIKALHERLDRRRGIVTEVFAEHLSQKFRNYDGSENIDTLVGDEVEDIEERLDVFHESIMSQLRDSMKWISDTQRAYMLAHSDGSGQQSYIQVDN